MTFSWFLARLVSYAHIPVSGLPAFCRRLYAAPPRRRHILLILLPSGTAAEYWICLLLSIGILSYQGKKVSSSLLPNYSYFYSVASEVGTGNFIMENARRVVAKITEFPWGQFCLCYCCRNCVSGSNKMWLETFQANFHDETKNISSFFLFRKQFYHFLGALRRIIGDHFWDLLLPPNDVAFVTLCEKAISQQISCVVPTTDVAARFLIRLKVVQKRKENGFYWWSSQ